jgi:hypothetical protein
MRTRRRTDDDAFDERGILRPGRSVRIPLAMRDGGDWRADMSRHLHRSELDDRRKKRTTHYDPRGRLAGTSETEVEEDDAMHDAAPRRPGFSRDALDRIEQAYREVELRDAEAWRHLSSAGETHDGPKAGDQCTVREGAGRYGIEGSPGRLREIDGRLVCVSTDHHDAMPEPTGNAQLDAAYLRAHAITDATERAYEMRRLDDENAWRKPL